MDDFIFGTLATDQLRLRQIRTLWVGVTHTHRRVPRAPLPGEAVTLELSAGPDYPCAGGWVYWTTDGSEPVGEKGSARNGNVLPLVRVETEWNSVLWGYITHFTVSLPGQTEGTIIRYCMSIISGNQGEIFADNGAWYGYRVTDESPPDWSQDAVVYHIFVDRFFPGEGKPWLHPSDRNGFYGGTLRGITEKLDYISELGVNILYLSPVYPSPSHHGYDATDFVSIEPRLGSMGDFKQLIKAAHRRGIKVLLDFVPNHCSNLHPAFSEAIARSDSPYRKWFTFTDYPDRYETFFGVRELPQFNLRDRGARYYVLDAARKWLDNGVDGFRLDYAIGPSPDFWADFRRVTRTANPDCWTFGEVVDPPDRQLDFEGGLDGCLDFVLLEGLRQTFAFGKWDAARLGEFLERHEAFFPADFSRPSFLDNHDMNRYLWAVAGDERRLRLAALCQFTLKGPPLIYYGTEVGLSQLRDVRQGPLGMPHEARLPMLWGDAQDKDLLNFYKNLIGMRLREPCLRRGMRRTLVAEYKILAYERTLGGDQVAVVLNLAELPGQVFVPGKWEKIELMTDAGCGIAKTHNGVSVSLSPLGGVVLK